MCCTIDGTVLRTFYYGGYQVGQSYQYPYCETLTLKNQSPLFLTSSSLSSTRTKKHLKMNKEIGMMLPKKS